MIRGEGHARGRRRFAHAHAQVARAAEQIIVKAGLTDNRHGRQACCHGDGIARERTGLIHRAQRRDLLHDVATPAKGAHWHTAPDDLTQAGEIRSDAQEALNAAGPEPEAGHHLVKDQYRAMASTELAHAFEIPLDRGDAVHVAGHGLGNHAGDLITQFVHGGLECREVIKGQGDGVLRQHVRHARRARHAKRQRTGAGLDQ